MPSCADPESFVRGGSTLTTFFFCYCFLFISIFSSWRGEGGPSSARQLACRWWPNIEFKLGSFVILRGSGLVLLRNPILLWFSGGVQTPHPLDPCMAIAIKREKQLQWRYKSKLFIMKLWRLYVDFNEFGLFLFYNYTILMYRSSQNSKKMVVNKKEMQMCPL